LPDLLVLLDLAGLAANLIVNLLVLEGLGAQGLHGCWARGDLFLVKVLPIVALGDPRFGRGAAGLGGGVGGVGGGEIDLAGEIEHPHGEVRLAASADVAAEALDAAAHFDWGSAMIGRLPIELGHVRGEEAAALEVGDRGGLEEPLLRREWRLGLQ
jgi:hypothetical protein